MSLSEKLYKILNLGKKNERKVFWEIMVVNDEIITKFYYENSTKMKEGVPTKAVAKNVGKKNETTAQQQAFKMMQSKIKAKINKEGYQYLHLEREERDFEVMSLKTSTRNEVWIEEGCFQQPKLDGIRCIALYKNDQWELYSKKHNKFLFLNHIKNSLLAENFDKSKIYDGELIHKKGFQTLINIVNVNRQTAPPTEQENEIFYFIFDVIDLNLNQTTRLAEIYKYVEINSQPSSIKIVESIEVCTWKDIEKIHTYFKEQKYEGSVIRHKNSNYVTKRSTKCMKIKDFDSFEVDVVSFTEGVGNDKGKVVWICEYNKQKFDCVPKITDNEREYFYINGKKYIGQKLTIQHQGFTNKGIPRFPIGICFRDFIE